MGVETSQVCRSCGTKFTVLDGGSRKADVLHCDVCGARTYVLFADVRDLHLRYDPGRFLCEAVETGYRIRYESPDGFRRIALYRAAVEDRLTPCACGGRFRHGAPPRCPICRSTEEMWDVDEAGGVAFLD